MYSSGTACKCTVESLCQSCEGLEGSKRLFVCRTIFQGLEPYGDHPFLGVSGCPFDGLGDGRPWLSCPSTSQRTELLGRMTIFVIHRSPGLDSQESSSIVATIQVR
jgi:hypothetical protein